MSDWPISFTHCILSPGNRSPGSLSEPAQISTRLGRWYPLHLRHETRPRYRDALTASFRAMAPALDGLHGLAFLRGGMTAWAPRAAIASWHLRVSWAPSAVTDPMACGLDLVQWFRQHGCITDFAGRNVHGPNLHRFLANPPLIVCFANDCRAMDVYLAPQAALGPTVLARVPRAFAFPFVLGLDACAIRCPAGYCAAMPERGSEGSAGRCRHDTAGSRSAFPGGGTAC